MSVTAWILGVPTALAAIVFAVANRADVRLDLWPFPWSVDLPIYLAVLGALALGVLLGLVAGWGAGAGARKRAREQKRRAESLERQLQSARADAALPVPVSTDAAA